MGAIPSLNAAAWPGSAVGNAAEPLDLVFIEGLVCDTVIGIYSSEQHRPQPLRIDLAAGVPHSRACYSDRIADAIDYGRVREAVLALIHASHVKLLEALAEQIAQLLLQDFGAHWVRVVVAKPKKCEDVQAMGVAIERRRPTGLPLDAAEGGQGL